MRRIWQFLAVFRSFFHSSLLCTISCHPSPPTILPPYLTSSCHLFLGLPLNLFLEFYFLPFSVHVQTNVIYLTFLSHSLCFLQLNCIAEHIHTSTSEVGGSTHLQMLVFANKITYHNPEDSILKYTPSQKRQSYYNKKCFILHRIKDLWLCAINRRNVMLQHVDSRFKHFNGLGVPHILNQCTRCALPSLPHPLP